MIHSQEEINDRVERIIDSIADIDLYQPSGYELSLLSKYNNCFDRYYDIESYKYIFEKILGREFNLPHASEFDVEFISRGVSVLVTNTGSGRILNYIPQNFHLQAYNNSFYCYSATKVLHQNRIHSKNMSLEFGDLSELFCTRTPPDATCNYAIVQSDPDSSDVYSKLDCDSNFNVLSPDFYYAIRSSFLVKTGGYIVLITNDLDVSHEELSDTFNKLVAEQEIKFVKKAAVVDGKTIVLVYHKTK